MPMVTMRRILAWGTRRRVRSATMTPIGLARADHETVEGILSRVADATGCYLYAGRLYRDERWELLHRGPGLDGLVGRPVAPEEGDEAFVAAVHPDDRAAWQAASSFDLLRARGARRGRAAARSAPTASPAGCATPTSRGPTAAAPCSSTASRWTSPASARAPRRPRRPTRCCARPPTPSRRTSTSWRPTPPAGTARSTRAPASTPCMGCARGMPISDEEFDAAIHPDDRAALRRRLPAAPAGHDSEIEYRLQGRDGVVRWVSDIGRARRLADGRVRIEGLIYDVSERRAHAGGARARPPRRRAPLAHRLADRRLQPPARRRGDPRGAAPRAARGRRAGRGGARPRRLQARERHARAPGGRRRAGRGRAAPADARCARTTSSAAGAGRSSPCWCRPSRTTSRCGRSASSCATPCGCSP